MTFNTSRRHFVKSSLLKFGTASLAGAALGACGSQDRVDLPEQQSSPDDIFFKLSLAQWSLHRSLRDDTISAEEFPIVAKERFGFTAVEYVNGFYSEQATDAKYWTRLNETARDSGVRNLLIMIDDEGDLGSVTDSDRRQAVENHYKWIDAAQILECLSVRVNGFGEGPRDAVGAALADSLGALAEYAGQAGINVVIENHGLYTSDGQWVAGVIRRVGRPSCGTLPDFGNFCLAKKWGSTQDGTCTDVYDRYQGVKEMMPFAKGVSAKSYRFDDQGQETTIDFGRMLRIVKDAGFTGHIGVEYEGNELDEPAGVVATKELLVSEGRKLIG